MRVLAAAIAVAGVLTAAVAEAGGASPTAQASSFSPCDISGQQTKMGASYVTSLKVQGVSCAKGRKVITAYHRCRHASGPGGSCGSKVLGFSCKDGKRTGVPNVQYNATAKCRKVSNPAKRIKSSYTQNV
jgi:hypothetical protein